MVDMGDIVALDALYRELGLYSPCPAVFHYALDKWLRGWHEQQSNMSPTYVHLVDVWNPTSDPGQIVENDHEDDGK